MEHPKLCVRVKNLDLCALLDSGESQAEIQETDTLTFEMKEYLNVCHSESVYAYINHISTYVYVLCAFVYSSMCNMIYNKADYNNYI